MLRAQRTTAQEVGLWEICRQEEARAQDVAPAQLGTYAMSGGLDTAVPGSHSLNPYLFKNKTI